MNDLALRNELTAFYNDYTETELALFLILCKHIQDNTLGNVEGKSYIQISYKDIFLGKNYTIHELEELIDSFRKKTIKTILLDDLVDNSTGVILGKKGSVIDNTPFYSILSNTEDKKFNCFINPFLISFIKEIMGNFTILDIQKILNLNGKYARKLYILIARYKNLSDNYRVKNPNETFKVEDLKCLLGYNLESLNKEFFRMLKKSLNEVEQFIPGLTYESIKTGRNITDVKFLWNNTPEKESIKKETSKINKTNKLLEKNKKIKDNDDEQIKLHNNLYEEFLKKDNDYKEKINKKAVELFLKETKYEKMNDMLERAFNMSKKSLIIKILKGEV